MWGFVHHSFIVRVAIILEPNWADFFQISVIACPGPYPQMFFFIFEKKMPYQFSMIFFSFLLTWDLWEENVNVLLVPQLAFEFFQKFLLIGPHKSTVLNF